MKSGQQKVIAMKGHLSYHESFSVISAITCTCNYKHLQYFGFDTVQQCKHFPLKYEIVLITYRN